MTKSYKIFSNAYRIILGLFIVFYLIISSIFSEIEKNDDNSGLWSLLFSILTITAITIFHRLENDNRYKKIFQFFVCALVLTSLAFLTYLIFTGEDGNLPVNSVFLISAFVNAVLLFFLIQDKKYNHNN